MKPGPGDPDPARPPGRFQVVMRPVRGLVALISTEQPLQLQLLGRTLLHAALVGLGAGILGCAFFAGGEAVQTLLLEQLVGYEPLRARGERVWSHAQAPELRLWLLLLVPALGALVAGWLTRFAPECRGGGGDTTIEAFHHGNGVVRRRALWVKPLASIATLGSGGSGGREGPTMLIGGALGSTVGRYLDVSPRERRVLMVAGIAAGISAVFRAPLGAALIAIEMLYRDDFESEALIPAVLASVVAYSISISVFGHATLFGALPAYAFHPRHIPLYLALALVVSIVASFFVGSLRLAHRVAARLPVADWLRPAIGGLALGAFAVVVLHYLGPLVGRMDRGVGVLGGGYGIAQVSITGADWLPADWTGVQILLVLAVAKIVATGFTIGSGGSAGDFAPSLAVGAMLGGAFGLVARLVLDDPSIEPGAFALVGMGTFYGGIAKTPLAALVLVCEMAGSYELLVPLMLAGGVAFVTLRRVALYPSQPPTARDSPVHQREGDALLQLFARDVLRAERSFEAIAPDAPIGELVRLADRATDQDVFPVVEAGQLRGLVSAEALRVVASNPELSEVAVVADLMTPAVSIERGASLRAAVQLMVANDLRALPVLDDGGAIVGMIDEHDIAAALIGQRRA